MIPATDPLTSPLTSPLASPQPALTDPAGAPSAQADQATRNALLSSDFQTFLTMLTTQMQNQDPLNPMASTDFAVQLATFSSVEQQIRGNQLLESLGAQLGVLGMAQLSGWVGMEARAAAPVHFDGNPVTLAPEPSPLAARADLVVRNALGNEVDRRPLSLPVTGPVGWAGFDGSGRTMSPGLYSFEVENHAADGLLSVTPVEGFARITEAQVIDGETVLILKGGARVPATEISALRAPEDPADTGR